MLDRVFVFDKAYSPEKLYETFVCALTLMYVVRNAMTHLGKSLETVDFAILWFAIFTCWFQPLPYPPPPL